MQFSKKNPNEPFKDFTNQEIADLVKSNDALDQEKAKIIQEEMEKEQKESWERLPRNKFRKTISKSLFEIINRCFFFVFLTGFLLSFVFIYKLNYWWFLLYVISSFSCIFYTPNRKALKELIAAWPNIEDLIKKRSLWK